MSLINQMLRDLDKRHALGNAQEPLPENVKPAPGHPTPDRAPSAFWLLGGVALIAAVGGGYWYLRPAPMQNTPSSLVPPAAAPKPPASPAVVVAPMAAPAAAPAAAPTATEGPKPSTKPEQAHPPERPPALAETPPAAPARKGMSLRLDSLTNLGTPAPRPRAETSAGPGSVEKKALPPDAPARLEQQYQEALGRLNRGQVREAMDSLRLLLQTAPAHADARQVLVRLLLEQGKPNEAIALLQDLARPGPGSLAISMQLARLQVEYTSDDAALQTLRAASASGAGDPEYHAFFATLLQRRQRYAEAAAEYRKALAVKPREGQWWAGLGMALDAGGSPQEAQSAWRNALSSGNLSTDLRDFIHAKLAGR